MNTPEAQAELFYKMIASVSTGDELHKVAAATAAFLLSYGGNTWLARTVPELHELMVSYGTRLAEALQVTE